MKPASLRIRILSRFGHASNDMYWLVIPAVLPLVMKEYGLTYASAGGFVSAYVCIVALFSFGAGRLADRMPLYLLLGGGFLVASLSLTAAALMPGILAFTLVMLIAAVGVGSFHPVAYVLVAESGGKRSGRAFSLFELSGSLGVLVLFLLEGSIVGFAGWRGVIMIVSVPGLIMGILFLGQRASLPRTEAPERADAKDVGHARPGYLLAVFFAAIALRTLSTTAVINFVPVFLVQSAGLSEGIGSYVAGFLFVGAIIANLFVGRIADRHGPVPVMLSASLVIGAFLFATTFVKAAWMLPPLLIVLGSGVSAAVPAQNMILAHLTAHRSRGGAFGNLMGIMTLTNSLGPLALGLLADHLGLATTFRIATVPVIAGFVVIASIARLIYGGPVTSTRQPIASS